MIYKDRQQQADSLRDPDERKSSKVILEAIRDAQEVFSSYYDTCKIIDDYYSREKLNTPTGFVDQDFDLFWASMEILKPAIYAQTPVPVAAPMFDDRDATVSLTADVVERCIASAFKRGDINQVMLGLRDDLAMSNRGAMWVRYDSEGGDKVCFEDLDRTDFLHEPARKWSDVGWVARRGWMTLDQMDKRFKSVPLDTLARAAFTMQREDRDRGATDKSHKAGVWEVWSRTDKRVYWVAEGVDTVLDEREPHLDLSGFFPCPRPAYGTTRRRSLIPIPDFLRYRSLLEQINDLTERIYELLDEVRLRGFYNGSSDRGAAINALFNDRSSMMQLVSLDAGLMQGSGGDPIQWLPIDMIANTIQGLIEARGQLFEDFYQLSGISDIMRGATEAQETLGAQRLKQQNGSVRVRDKQHELERIAADAAGIAAEIIAENFSQDDILEMSQMEIRSKSEIQKQIKDTEKRAKDELRQLSEAAQEAPEGVDPAQAEAQFNAAQQEIIEKYQGVLQSLSREVSIEDVMKILRDSKARNMVIEVETDSTIMKDEFAAKQAANEFYGVFTAGMQGLAGAAAMGPEAVKMATEVFKMTIAPYRPARSVLAAIDEFTEAAPEIARRMGDGAEDDGGLAQANMALAEAEMQKAQAQTQKVEADAALKMQELQLRTAEAQAKSQQAEQKFALEVQEAEGKIAKTQADIEKIHAEIMLAAQKLGIDARREDREDVKAEADIALRANADSRADMAQFISSTTPEGMNNG